MIFSFAGIRSHLTDVATMLISLLAAHLSYTLIEQPFLRMKDHILRLGRGGARVERPVPTSTP
jgi:peptidoglycan/LPS O-acetylase OafA/YrhL